MMADKELYLIAQFDEKTDSILSSYYKTLQKRGFIGHQTKGIPYHLTLGQFDVCEEERVVGIMEAVSNEISEIEIRLDHIGVFGLGVLFIEPNVNIELLELHRRFFPESGSGFHGWAAHATMLIDEPDCIVEALRVLAGEFEPINAKIQSIVLLECFPPRLIIQRELKPLC